MLSVTLITQVTNLNLSLRTENKMATNLKDSQPDTSGSPQNLSPHDFYNGRYHKKAAFGAGLFAGGIFTLSMLVLLWTSITPRSLANLVADRLSNLLPASFTEFFIQSIGPLGKQAEFFSVLLGQTIFGGLLGLLFVWIWPQIQGKQLLARNVFIFMTIVWLVCILVGLPLVNTGFLGVQLGDQQVSTLELSFVLFQVFALAFFGFFQRLVPATTAMTDSTEAEEKITIGDVPSRRRFVLIVTGLFVAAATAAVVATSFRSNGDNNRGQLGATTLADGTLQDEVTSNADFYHVSKNAVDPTVNANGWKLQIEGLVNTPYSLTLAELKSNFPPQTQYQTLTCISNPVGGPYISNAKWKGVPLKAILDKAGVKSSVKRVVFKAADGYTDSIDYEKALDPQTLAAYEMNDSPLPDDHGGPLRLLIPNIYGMKNAKWVTNISLIDDANYEGYWQQQGWDNTAIINTESAITFPSDNQSVKAGQATIIRGFAFAGERGVQKVEVSTDGGQTWNQANLKEALSPNSWALWNYSWTPATSNKSYTILVRATDKTGTLQTSTQADTFPSGSSGWHTIVVTASNNVATAA
jgi:DMSO/TMAO reductase YedYZ molybdopterin-dependent catalytic subunit